MAITIAPSISTSYPNSRRVVRLSDGTLYCVYFRSPNGAWQIYVKKSTDNGQTWTGETLISTYEGMDAATQGSPSIAVDSNDNLHVVWHGGATGFAKFQVWYNKFNGSTWSGPVRISDLDGMTVDHQHYASIAVDGSDNVHVVWEGVATGFGFKQTWYSKYSGTWSEPVRISTYTDMEDYEQVFMAITVDSSGNLHVVWTGKAAGFTAENQIWYAKYTDSWATPVRISTADGMADRSNLNPSIAVDSDDYLHVAFTSHNRINYAKYTDSWATPILISVYEGMGLDQHYPSIAVDTLDVVYVVWHGKTTGYPDEYKIWLAKYTASWSVELLQDEAVDLQNPNIRWSRYPSGNIPVNGVDYVFFDGTNIYWDKKGFPFIAAPTVATNQATAVEATTATLKGTLEDDGGEACDVRFQYGETIAYGTDTEWQLDKESVVAFEQAIIGLDPSKTYHFRAQARNNAGTVNGADRTFTTLIAAPTVTTNPATGRGVIAATLNGTLDNDGGEVCQCGFEWGLSAEYGTITPPQSKRTGEAFSQVIGGLFPGTTYHFRAFATNSIGTSHGADESFATALVISKAFALAREEL